MRKGVKTTALAVVIPAILIVGLVVSLKTLLGSLEMLGKRTGLASALNVDLYHFPWPLTFPASYFGPQLTTGTSLDNAHAIVRGSQRILHCPADSGGSASEVYYFYSASDADALKLEVIYDAEKRVERVVIEDKDSMPISTTGCLDGYLAK
jgi:hypothetical protein